MSVPSFVRSLFLLAAVGCSGSEGPGLDPQLPEFTEQCAPEACSQAATAATSGELAAAITTAASWRGHGDYTTGCLPASGNIVVSGTVNVAGAAIARPSTCTSDCGTEVRYRIRGTVPGVTCIGPEYLFDFTMCESIEVIDATIRVRAVVEDVHPYSPNSLPIVEVLAACNSACASGELRCEETHTCWGSARDYCAYCLGGDNEVCACWDGEGFAADDTLCDFFVSGDSVIDGTCHSGICETE